VRILVNDHAGHPFQVQLSRSLAKRGHTVLHTYCAALLTPRGSLDRQPGDPAGLEIAPIVLDKPFDRYGLLERWRQELELGDRIVARARSFRPDVLISANTPLGTQARLVHHCTRASVAFVFWVQDVLSVGIRRALEDRLPIAGAAVGAFFHQVEQWLLTRSDRIVVITDDFLDRMPRRANERVTVIENWAPLDELPRLAKHNAWSREHDLTDKTCLLYAGTLGMKHNPDLLVRLATALRDRDDVRLVVISEGPGADYVRQRKESDHLDHLVLLPFQPFERMPQVLASADVLIAILEPDAGAFAVPSKVLTYLCAERPLLLAVPATNLAARIVERAAAGIVVAPTDVERFVSEAMRLLADTELRASLARGARRYAESTFDIDRITDRFEQVLTGARARAERASTRGIAR
jgi:glycosyltransferase involved in cell wall biosynthesis